jgi:hypothetical protein
MSRSRVEETKVAYRVLAGKPEGRRPLGIHNHRGEDNIRMYLGEVAWGAWNGQIWLRRRRVGGLL